MTNKIIDLDALSKYNENIQGVIDTKVQKLMTDTELKFFCIEPVSIVINGESTTYAANTLVDIFLKTTDEFEVIPTSNSSISSLYAWPSSATSCMIELEDLIVEDAYGNVITKPDYVGFYDRTYSQKVDQYRIADNEAIVITESGSNKRAQFGSSSSYTYGTCVIKMKFKLKYT